MSPTPKGTPVVLYVRVSTVEQAEEGVSLEAQEKALRLYAELRGLVVVEVVTDPGVSASKALADRPGGARVLNLVRRRKVGAVLTTKLDRLFRDAADCLTVVRAWDRAGVSLHLTDMGGQAIDTSTAVGRMFLTFLAGLAEMERSLIAERTKTALAHKRSKGERVSRWLPFGWKLADDGVHLVEHPQEQRAIELIQRLRVKGYSQRAIADALNRRRIPSRGREWHKTTVARVLNRESLAAA